MKLLFKIVFKPILIVAGLFILYYLLKAVGEAERGFEAVGGEILIFCLPIIFYAIKRNVEDGKQG